MVVDGEEKTVKLALRAHQILDTLNKTIEQIKYAYSRHKSAVAG